MECVIPILVGGALYIINKERKEGFEDNTSSTEDSVSSPEEESNHLNPELARMCQFQTQPTPNIANTINTEYDQSCSNTNTFAHQGEYFEQNTSTGVFTSLTGESMNLTDFKHNNQVPFMGSKSTQDVGAYKDNEESYLDNKTGVGSQHIKKEEIAPLFAPQESMKHTFGMPNYNDMMQSRVVPSLKQHSTKPFAGIRVGPGTARVDDIQNGIGGFNAGMIGRDQWMPKNVDELRVDSNQKHTYEGRTIHGKSNVTNRGFMGIMEKNRPDRYYINSPERYITTTGLEKAPTARAKDVLKVENRIYTTGEHYGNPEHGRRGDYAKSKVQEARRPELEPDINHASNLYSLAENRNARPDINNYKNSQITNNRDITHNTDGNFGSLTTTVKAMVSPIMDILRPTRKMNVIGNARGPGNTQISVSKGTVFNPADRTRTTIREFTENESGHRFIGSQGSLMNRKESGYYTNIQSPVDQQRDTTQYSSMGNVGQNNTTSGRMVYDAAYNASLIDKSVISQGRTPTQNNVKLHTGPAQYNLSVRKDDTRMDNGEYIRAQKSIYGELPSKDKLGMFSSKNNQRQNNDIQTERNHADLLDAFKKNPYTQSLSSF